MASNYPEQKVEKENLGFLPFLEKLKLWFSLTGTIIAVVAWSLFILVVAIFEDMAGYKRRKAVNEQLFWQYVYMHLRDHGLSEDQAKQLVEKKHKEIKLATAPDKTFYYQRPQDVANDLNLCSDKNYA